MRKKSFLLPLARRRGQPTLLYVTKDKERLMIGVYHEFTFDQVRRSKTGRATGTGKDYSACSESLISKTFYNAFMKEREAIKARYDKAIAFNKKNFRKCPVCKCSKRIGKPCKICEEMKNESKKS